MLVTQASSTRCGVLEGLVGEGEARPHLDVTGGELAQAAGFVGQALDQGGDAHTWTAGKLRRGDVHRQRQVAAEPHHLCRRLRLGVESLWPGDAGTSTRQMFKSENSWA